jgi:DNA-binding response OmpR family regulator
MRMACFTVRSGAPPVHAHPSNHFPSVFAIATPDLMLPGHSGLDVCRELRSHVDTPIVMVTARGDDRQRNACSHLAAQGLIFDGRRGAKISTGAPVHRE